MTVHYGRKLLNVQRQLYGLLKLMFMWKGSVFKMIWPELLFFSFIYFCFNIMYNFILNDFQKEIFETIAKYCDEFSRKLPLSFVLGFFAASVLDRFWFQFEFIPQPVDLALPVGILISGNDLRGQILKRSIVRYAFVGFVIVATTISSQVMKRFPTYEHYIKAGFLTKEEKEILENTKTNINKYIIPFNWASLLLQKARLEKRIDSTLGCIVLQKVLTRCRVCCGTLTILDIFTVPLAYTQVVIMAVFIFSASCVMGRHFLDENIGYNYFFPLITIFQFIFYVGWLKVCLGALHAYGSDDDDFELNSLVDMYLKESYFVLGQLQEESPKMYHDKFWNKPQTNIPYTDISLKTLKPMFYGSATNYKIPATHHKIVDITSTIEKKNK